MSLRSISILVLFMLSKVMAADSRTCYWADGSTVASTNNTEVVPCHDGDSHCCRSGEACLSTGLCYSADGGTVSTICTPNSVYSDAYSYHRHTAADAQTRPGKQAPALNIATTVRARRL